MHSADECLWAMFSLVTAAAVVVLETISDVAWVQKGGQMKRDTAQNWSIAPAHSCRRFWPLATKILDWAIVCPPWPLRRVHTTP